MCTHGESYGGGSEIARRSWDLVRLKKMKVGEGGGDGEDDDVAKR